MEILRKLDHPSILKVYEIFEDQYFYYMVTEVCDGGELFDEIINKGFLTEKVAADMFKQMT